jgi:C4-dicarboxylate-specific signal transduction histidine kinase
MKRVKVIEPTAGVLESSGPYYKIAVQVREILRCEYALVATPENDSIRLQAIASEGNASSDLAINLISKLRDWGPIVVDDSSLVAVPVCRDQTARALLVGYSSKRGTFTGDDLQRLMAFSQVAAHLLENARGTRTTSTQLSNEELMHFSRLVTIGELSSCFAHEVGNPLMLIRGHLQFVEGSITEDHPLRMHFEVIDRASKRIEEMSKWMLDFSRKRSPRKEKADLGEVISDALLFIQPYFRAQYIEVRVQLEPNLPFVSLDKWQMVQAVVNLLQNAADAMADQSKRILSITARVEGSQVRVGIADTGTGIAAVNAPHIFEPFFTTKGERGTGLGLCITRQVIQDHGGAIDVQTDDRGTTFVISLPL